MPENRGLLKYLMGLYAQTPSAVRAYAESPFTSSPITEDFFSPKELHTLSRAAQSAKSRGSRSISYMDYPREAGHSAMPSVGRAFVKPEASAMYTVGRANFTETPSGEVVLKDTYDFSRYFQRDLSSPDTWKRALANPMELIESLGTLMVPEGQGRPVEINLGRLPDKAGQPRKPVRDNGPRILKGDR